MKQDNKPHKPNYNPNKEPSQGNPFQQQKPHPQNPHQQDRKKQHGAS